jgi:hypothetical protein
MEQKTGIRASLASFADGFPSGLPVRSRPSQLVAELALYVDFPTDSAYKAVRLRPRAPEILDV